MKKVFFALVALIISVGVAQAQEEGAKLAKQAGKALASYNLDQKGNAAKLGEAIQKIEDALKLPDAQALASAWLTKGDAHNARINKDMIARLTNPAAPMSGENDALEAFNAYQKAFELAQKKFEKTDALKGIAEVQNGLSTSGIARYEKQEYEQAFMNFNAFLKSHDVLSANGQKSVLDDKAQYDQNLYYTALFALLGKRNTEAMALYERIYKAGTDKAEIYEGLIQLKMEAKDEAGAEALVAEGRKKFPDNTSMLFAEINSYLRKGKLDELVGSLKTAIAAEPNNVALYVTLGNVYENLYQRALKDKDDAKSLQYYTEAKTYYTQATEKDPKNADATYALGALYYNKAALRTQELNALPEDYSSAGIKKYEVLKKEIMGLFDEALPFFQKAEILDPNDTNTLIALTEIYARKEDDLALEFKKRLQVVKDGKKNETSYFKK
jgi:tetratricopeptide (TPR) repeat protein